jgi:hypothetical protein
MYLCWLFRMKIRAITPTSVDTEREPFGDVCTANVTPVAFIEWLAIDRVT